MINLGRISSTGGDVFLVSRKTVANLGTVNAPKAPPNSPQAPRFCCRIRPPGNRCSCRAGNGGQVLNAGTIRAAQINLQATDGNVYALAGSHSVLRATGTATRDGHVWLVADGGTVDAQCTIDATNADGSGGTVDTSGNT